MQLEANNVRSLDTTGGTRLPHRMEQTALPDLPSYHLSEVRRGVHAGDGRGAEPASERSSSNSVTLPGTICEQIVLGGKEGRILPPSGEPATTELLCEETPLQNGRVRDDQGSAAGRRLDVFTGPKGRIPVSISVQRGQEILAIYLGQQDVRVHLPSIWALQCPPHLYKTPPASDGTSTDTRSSVHYLSGRHPDNASIQGGVAASGTDDSTSAGISGLYYQRRQITAGPIPGDSIPGVSSGCQTNEVLPSGGENTRHCSGLPGDPGPGKVVNSTTVTTFGQVECGLPSSSVSPNSLPSTATVENPVTQKVKVIRHTGDLRPKSGRGAVMVERSTEELEWEGHSSPTSRHGDRNRCLQHWLGSSVSRSQDRRTVVPAGAGSAHKCSRVDGSLLGSEDICERQPQGSDAYPFENGQCLSPDLCQSDGGDSLPRADEGSLLPLGLVPATRNHLISFPPARSQQPDSRPGIEGGTDIGRVEVGQRPLPQGMQHPGPLQCGSVRQSPELPTVPVYQLEAGPGGDEHRCLSEQLDKPEMVRFPSVCADRQMPSEDKGGAEHRSADCSHMAKPDMVPGIIGNADRSSNPSPLVQGYADKPREPATPTGNSK